LDAVLPKVNIS